MGCDRVPRRRGGSGRAVEEGNCATHASVCPLCVPVPTIVRPSALTPLAVVRFQPVRSRRRDGAERVVDRVAEAGDDRAASADGDAVRAERLLVSTTIQGQAEVDHPARIGPDEGARAFGGVARPDHHRPVIAHVGGVRGRSPAERAQIDHASRARPQEGGSSTRKSATAPARQSGSGNSGSWEK